MSFTFNGEEVHAYRGETLAAALLAHGITGTSRTREGLPRLPLCNMGTCFDCAVTVDGVPMVRSCLTPVAESMEVSTWQSS